MSTKVCFVCFGLLLGVALLQAATEIPSRFQEGNLTTTVIPSKPTSTNTSGTFSAKRNIPPTLPYFNLTSSNSTNTISNTSKTTIPTTSNSVLPTFMPKLCEQRPWNNSDTMGIDGEIAVHFLQPMSASITLERSSVDLKCEFCITKPLQWTKILWYKDDKPLESDGSDRIHISKLQHYKHEGLYKCVVVTPNNNKTASGMVTLIVNKDPLFSMVPHVWARNITFTRATKILWQVRSHGLFDALKVTVTVRQLGESKWQYKREFTEFISGSTELDDLEPNTVYIANVSVVNSYGHNECRSMAFWSNARNSTDFDDGVLGLSVCTRDLVGFITGAFGFLLSLCVIYYCCSNPTCDDFRSHQGYDTPLDDIAAEKYDHNKDTEGFATNYVNIDSKEDIYKV